MSFKDSVFQCQQFSWVIVTIEYICVLVVTIFSFRELYGKIKCYNIVLITSYFILLTLRFICYTYLYWLSDYCNKYIDYLEIYYHNNPLHNI